MILPTG